MSFRKQVAALRTRPGVFYLAIFSLPLIDELVSGVPVLTTPLLRSELQLSYAQVGLLFTVAELAGFVVDPLVNTLSDQWPKRRLLLGGILGLAAGFALAAASPSFGLLLIGLMIIGAANGAALGLGQALLIDAQPATSLRTMTRWTMMAALGDLLAPLLVATALAVQFGWRTLWWGSALIWLAAAAVIWRQRFAPAHPRAGEATYKVDWPGLRANLLMGLRSPHLLRWIFLDICPTMLDELFLVFAALFLTDKLGTTPAVASLFLMTPVIGGLGGLALLHVLGARYAPIRLLQGSALVTMAGLVVFLVSRAPLLTLFGLGLAGLGAAFWYPIMAAGAYDSLPGRSGTVRALGSLRKPLEIALPLLLGLAAERWGIAWGVGLLLAAPVAVLLLAPRPGRAPDAEVARLSRTD
ncbi:MAG: MFS transporter [Caldilineaceae bacterium]|nr:MFS transporter [Caldilineaceae bacterium]